MAIVTLSRQLGTPGEELAARLASLLGCRLMDSEGLDREMSRRGLAPSVKERWEAALLRELADRETLVVLGLAGQCVFADRKDAVHVRLVGSWEGRTRRLVAERSVSEVEAAGLLVQSDRERAERIRRRYGVDWNDPSLYHLVINADRTPPAQAARLLSALVEAQAGAAPPMGASAVARVLPPGVPVPPPTVDEDLAQPSPAPAALQAAAIQPGEQAGAPVPAAGTGSRSRRRRRRGRNRAEGSPLAAGGAQAPGAALASAGPHPAATVAGEPAGEATEEPAPVPAAEGRATAEPVIYGISRLKPGLPPHLRPYPSQHAVCSWEHKRPAFAHPSEEEFARMLDFYQIRWVYEPTTFPIEWDAKGNMTAAFTPDFYLPDIDTFIELTTMKQNLTARKNRKIRRLRQLYPGIDVKVFYGRDFRSLLRKYGKDDEEDRLTGSIDGPAAQNGAGSGQKAPRVLPPPTPRAAARGGEAVREPAAEAVSEGLAEPPAQPPAVPVADRAADRVFDQAVDAAADRSVGTAAKVAADQVASPAADRVAHGAAKPASAAVPEPVWKAGDAEAAEPEAAEPVAVEPATEPATEPAVEPAVEPATEAATPVAGAAAETEPVTGSAPVPASEGAKKPRRQRRARSATSGASAGSKAAAAAAGSRRRTGTGRRRKSTAAPQQAVPGTQPQGPDGAGDSLEVEARQLDQGRREVAAAAEEASPARALTVTGSPATATEGAGTAAADAAGAFAAAVDGAPAAAAGQGTQGAGKRAPARRPARRRRTRTESGR